MSEQDLKVIKAIGMFILLTSEEAPDKFALSWASEMADAVLKTAGVAAEADFSDIPDPRNL